MTFPLFKRPTSDECHPCKVAYDAPNARSSLIHSCQQHLQMRAPNQSTTVICIGTDRSTGDCLGPLVGTRLSQLCSQDFRVLGTLHQPVHAMNLQETIDSLQANDPHTFIIAVDACLGQSSSVGSVQVVEGPVRPGAGVNKQLPPIGDMHITGIVNVGGFMEYFVLQNTRLHLVMGMADVIADTIEQSLTALSYRP
ncbi:spore protease YyaC [Paenibacillus alvei]|uniref:Spore protease YyaC n=1 Tax=Paenibacillus alvei TaxID=44250 RepID=A0AAP7DJH5_PAEAL|nr:spore protease YyaC [Paenibacillus alvei]MBG9734388.1 sporulation protein [Paenibacillus alvei]MBG9744310.1 sporulation protein [Paenibacillus alvei]MCY9578003.1 spore protease YyaC [Paenibacillus alvei]MCY9585297.1 spore protease YyaC [Paenibacillus alvei]NEZ44336.1 spore protease YyaC [Paenibacillus alvei]